MAERSEQNMAPESNDSTAELDNFCKNFTFLDTTTCCHCNGFYGPNFDEPVCVSCHNFIFASQKRRRELDDIMPKKFPCHDYVTGDLESNPALPRNPQEPMTFPSSAPMAQPSQSRGPRVPLQLKDLKEFFGEIEQKQNNNETRKESENEPAIGNTHINELPLEMIEKIFCSLDEETLFAVSKVSKHWEHIMDSKQEMWKNFTNKRWPLLHRNTETTNWLKMYGALMSSCCCRICVDKMIKISNNRAGPKVTPRARMDIKNGFQVNGIRIIPLNGKHAYLQGSIVGPPNSPYEGGIFYLQIYVPHSYPYQPPVIKFLTKIIHPNVSRHGDIGLDIITSNYSTALTLSKLLLSIQSLLCDPFTETCMEPEVGRLYDKDRRRFDALARYWTEKYAMMDNITFDD